jgi:bifunctional oligoribonuclease and PAP phosphatase NrnA
MPKRVAKQIFQAIQAAEKILLVSHKNPDGDTLGSLAAMMQYLRHIDKPHVAFCATDMSPNLSFLPHIDYVSQDQKLWDDTEVDLVISFDCSSPDYAGIEHVLPILKERGVKVANIDHHKTNPDYGDLNLVIPSASSTTEILYDFFVYNNMDIPGDTATCLLTGIVTDTGNFSNAATTKQTMCIASKLIAKGGNLAMIQGWVLKDKTVSGLKLWGTVLSRMTHHEPLDIVYTYVTKDDVKTHGVSEYEVEGIANFMNHIKDGRAGMILKEKEDGTIKGSFRTTHDHVDVSAFAKIFGGGGHKKASGFSVEGPLEHAIEHIFEKIHLFERGELALAEV